MELILILIVAVVAFVVGWNLRGIIIMARLASDPEAMMETLRKIKEINDAQSDDELKEVIKRNEATELAIERVNNHLYAYTKDTNQFIAQGTDLKALLEEAHKRFPGKVFFGNIPADDPAKELA